MNTSKAREYNIILSSLLGLLNDFLNTRLTPSVLNQIYNSVFWLECYLLAILVLEKELSPPCIY